jgi:hypothetical protein
MIQPNITQQGVLSRLRGGREHVKRKRNDYRYSPHCLLSVEKIVARQAPKQSTAKYQIDE